MKGKFVLVPFPFTDLTTTKVLFDGKSDVVVAFVSSKISEEIPNYCIKIYEPHEEFSFTGLKIDSVIRLDKVATIQKKFNFWRNWRSQRKIEK